VATAKAKNQDYLHGELEFCSESFACTDMDSGRTVSGAGVKEMGSLLGLMLQREGGKPLVSSTGKETL